ncbi:anti-phage deoxyguanosine triphosphatase [Providencia sp. PROV252]|uniref:anti-phage deoxyguanosine triphosphatase n=1 Tax=Providencia sp. PROV252 TaxID=2936799 RepID=UPI00298FAD43|nr:anti-phage deoxyguanosine triphosphatase [Providencia sp. PROV252]
MENVWKERIKNLPRRDVDVRNEWEKDYARLIHSSAFRRLQSKTQVLGLGESDFYRTRLTHSMEVAQIGVGIVRWLSEKYKSKTEILDFLPKSALMNSICMAHDIGHPPFGHGGEVALNLCMRDYGGFEGNGQTLRILSKLDKYTANNGMNPTRRLLLGVLKYPASYSDTVQKSAYGAIPQQRWLCKSEEQKPPKCYLDDERDVVQWILDPLTENERSAFIKLQPHKSGHLKPMYKGLDTSIMELADDISYSLHDLEDAISLGMITKDSWDSHNIGKSDLFEKCGMDIHNIGNKLFSSSSYLRKNTIGGLVHKFIINTYINETGIPDAITPLIKLNAYMKEEYESLRKHIFDLVKGKVIDSPNVQQLEFKGQKLVIELFDILSSDPKRLLPNDSKNRYNEAENEAKKMRVICDFISGMTDEYATRFYEKLCYPHKGSIFDRL